MSVIRVSEIRFTRSASYAKQCFPGHKQQSHAIRRPVRDAFAGYPRDNWMDEALRLQPSQKANPPVP